MGLDEAPTHRRKVVMHIRHVSAAVFGAVILTSAPLPAHAATGTFTYTFSTGITFTLTGPPDNTCLLLINSAADQVVSVTNNTDRIARMGAGCDDEDEWSGDVQRGGSGVHDYGPPFISVSFITE
jgi:hypothetical protein